MFLKKFQIPQKLYGRQSEIEEMLNAFERIRQGTKEMVLVTGYSGIGKTAVVHEIHKPIVKRRGYFISGKFEQFERDIPYASLIQAFQELVRQLLTESKWQIKQWKEKLLSSRSRRLRLLLRQECCCPPSPWKSAKPEEWERHCAAWCPESGRTGKSPSS